MTLKTGVTEVADSEEEFMTSSPITNLDGVHEHLPQLASGTADSKMPTTSDESMIINETTPINYSGTISLPANEQSNTIINDMNTSVSKPNHSSGAISSTADIARVEGGDLPEPILLQTETGIREELDTVNHIDPVTNTGGAPLTKSPNVTKQQTTRPSPTPSDQSTALEQVVPSGNDDVVDREGSFDTYAPSVSHHKSSSKETTGTGSRIQPELTEEVLSDTKHSELVSDTHDLSEPKQAEVPIHRRNSPCSLETVPGLERVAIDEMGQPRSKPATAACSPHDTDMIDVSKEQESRHEESTHAESTPVARSQELEIQSETSSPTHLHESVVQSEESATQSSTGDLQRHPDDLLPREPELDDVSSTEKQQTEDGFVLGSEEGNTHPTKSLNGLADDSNMDIDSCDATANPKPEPQPIPAVEPAPELNTSARAKSSQELKLEELRAERAALIASLAAVPKIQEMIDEDDTLSSQAFEGEPTEADIMAVANKIAKRHIKLLHEYNEIKDAGQGLMGLIADQRGVRIVEIQDEFGIGSND